MIPRSHPLAGVRDAFNAVFVEAEAAGELMFYGRGAGGEPTACAVLGDIVAVAAAPGRRRPRAGRVRLRRPAGAAHGRRPRTRYHISLDVADRPGVLAQVAHGLRRARGVDRDRAPAAGQRDRTATGPHATLVVVTHTAHRRRAGGDRRRPRGAATSSRPWPVRHAGGRGVIRGSPVARCHRGVPRPAAGHRRDAGRHAAARAARRWSARRHLSELTGCEVLPQGRGDEPDRFLQGPRHDHGDLAWPRRRAPRP